MRECYALCQFQHIYCRDKNGGSVECALLCAFSSNNLTTENPVFYHEIIFTNSEVVHY